MCASVYLVWSSCQTGERAAVRGICLPSSFFEAGGGGCTLPHKMSINVIFVKASESGICGDGKLTTVGFRTSTHKIPQEFWTKGVDNSKIILETILDKIKFFEEISDSAWIDFVRENFATDDFLFENGECLSQKYKKYLILTIFFCR